MWGFGSASCYESVARAYYDAYLEQMRSQYRELPIPRHLPPFILPSFVQFMRDHQQLVEEQQDHEAVCDVSELIGNEDLAWLWDYGSLSSLFTHEHDAFPSHAVAIATPTLSPSSEARFSLKRVQFDYQLDRLPEPSCIDWLVEKSNAIVNRIRETHRGSQQAFDSTILEVDPIGFDHLLPPMPPVEAIPVELKHFKLKTMELPCLDTESARGSKVLREMDEKRCKYMQSCIDDNIDTSYTAVSSSSTMTFFQVWVTDTVDLTFRTEIDQIHSSSQDESEKKKYVTLREKSSTQYKKLPQKFRLDPDYLFNGAPDAALEKQSVEILKKMIRCNAQVSLLLHPDSSLDIFYVMQKQIYTWNLMYGVLAGSTVKSSSLDSKNFMLQQILFPAHVAREDDSMLDAACESIIVKAHQFLTNLIQLSRVPTPSTIITSEISSLWNQKGFQNTGADWIQENPTWETSYKSKPVSKVCDLLDTPEAMPAGQMPILLENGQNEKNVSLRDKEHQVISSEIEDKKMDLEKVIGTEPNERFIDDIPIATEDLVSSFFRIEERNESVSADIGDKLSRRCEDEANPLQDQVPADKKLIYQLTRPVLWDLVRKKVMRVDAVNFQVALDQISLDVLEAIIFKLHAKVKQLSLNPSTVSHEEIVDACSSFRQVVWLHSLRMIQLCPQASNSDKNGPKELVRRMRSSLTYQKAIGPSHEKDLCRLYEDEIALSVNSNSSEIRHQRVSTLQAIDNDVEPPAKRRRVLVLDEEQEKIPVRVLCSVGFLSKEGLLDELCSDQGISIIERGLPEPIDLIIDERNAACTIDASLFEDTSQMKALTFKLAAVQMQFQKIWIVIFADRIDVFKRVESNLHSFYAALVNFRVEVQPMTSSTDEETSALIRLIIDQCAKDALEEHRTLPQMWYQRPYILDEESQHERFLASTQILNHFSAQSLLHKISTDDLFLSNFADLKAMAQDSVSEHQLTLLWGMLHQSHGIHQ